MSELIPVNFGAISTKFAGTPVVDDLSSGIQSSFALVGYKGKVWSLKYRGDETQLLRDDGDGPRGSIEVVILKASQSISKIYYKDGYVEGSNAAPDCFSNNGVTPEATSTAKQCESCAVCPHNQWGSRITPAGKQGKSCADSKRIAVAPLQDLENTVYGGPMLLRVPAASLQDLAMYGQKMQQMGYPYYSIGTKIAFDPGESYPKFVFSGVRPLSDAEADIVLSAREGHTVSRILSESEFGPAPAAAPAEAAPLFEQAPDVGARVAAVEPVADTSDADEKAAAEALAKAKAAATAKKAAATKAANEKAAAEKAAAEKAAAEAEARAAAALAAASVTPEVTESDEDREIREAEEAYLKIKAAAAAKKAAAASATVAPVEPVKDKEEADPATTGFAAELDDMLNGLLG